MNNYIIYTYLGKGNVLYPNFIKAENLKEAIEILCVSKNSKKQFLTNKDLFDKLEAKNEFICVDCTNYDENLKGFLFIKHILIKNKQTNTISSCPMDFCSGFEVNCDNNCKKCWSQLLS